MACDLNITDCFGRLVALDHSNWQKHIVYRPEIGPHHADLATVLTDPTVVVEASRDSHYHFYRLGLTTGRFTGMYLRVVVEYFPSGHGKVKTAWICRTVDTKGTVRWMRET